MTPTLRYETERRPKRRGSLVAIGIAIGMAISFGSIELGRRTIARLFPDIDHGAHP